MKEQNQEAALVQSEELALDDARRVKVLSPSAMVVKRFLANRLSLVGLCIIVFIFLFSFLGGVLMPYRESQVFMTIEEIVKDYVYAAYNTTIQTVTPPGMELPVISRGTLVSAIQRDPAGVATSVSVDGTDYTIRPLGEESWLIDARAPLATIMRTGAQDNFSPASGGGGGFLQNYRLRPPGLSAPESPPVPPWNSSSGAATMQWPGADGVLPSTSTGKRRWQPN
ncbi:MAG: hypothetical protein LBT11_01860 [Treponema sp.]|jgi:hypothetical protein|nr:hypothetical protein [Treponema sp.]